MENNLFLDHSAFFMSSAEGRTAAVFELRVHRSGAVLIRELMLNYHSWEAGALRAEDPQSTCASRSMDPWYLRLIRGSRRGWMSTGGIRLSTFTLKSSLLPLPSSEFRFLLSAFPSSLSVSFSISSSFTGPLCAVQCFSSVISFGVELCRRNGPVERGADSDFPPRPSTPSFPPESVI